MSQPEVWLRGPLPDVPALLQPVAPDEVWARPAGVASVGFHVRHAAGSIDRLLTYARGEQLSAEQLAWLAAEGEPDHASDVASRLVTTFDATVERALAQLRATPESTLRDAREVGRGRLPSTVIGLLVHAAEHTQRHAGQLLTTARVACAERRR